MSESEQRSRRDDSLSDDERERGKGAEERIGRALGKAFGKLKRTKVWKDTQRAYREGLEGKPER